MTDDKPRENGQRHSIRRLKIAQHKMQRLRILWAYCWVDKQASVALQRATRVYNIQEELKGSVMAQWLRLDRFSM